MLALIRAIHAEVKGAYGSPRMVRELRSRGFPASKARVERLMREHGLHARHKRRYRVTTDSKHGLPVADNLLARNFTPTAPNQVWTSDITYLWTDEGWLYLAIVLDLFNREVVGWSLKPRMTSELVTEALEPALAFLEAARTTGREIAGREGWPVKVFDPVPMRLVRLARRERAQLLVEGGRRPALHAFLERWVEALRGLPHPRSLRWRLEVDPLET